MEPWLNFIESLTGALPSCLAAFVLPCIFYLYLPPKLKDHDDDEFESTDSFLMTPDGELVSASQFLGTPEVTVQTSRSIQNYGSIQREKSGERMTVIKREKSGERLNVIKREKSGDRDTRTNLLKILMQDTPEPEDEIPYTDGSATIIEEIDDKKYRKNEFSNFEKFVLYFLSFFGTVSGLYFTLNLILQLIYGDDSTDESAEDKVNNTLFWLKTIQYS